MIHIIKVPKHEVPEKWLNRDQKHLDSETIMQIRVSIAEPTKIKSRFDCYPPEERAIREKHPLVNFREPIPPEKLEEIKASRDAFVEAGCWGRYYSHIKKEDLVEVFSLDYIIDVDIHGTYTLSYRDSYRWVISSPFHELVFRDTEEALEQFCSTMGFYIVGREEDPREEGP